MSGEMREALCDVKYVWGSSGIGFNSSMVQKVKLL